MTKSPLFAYASTSAEELVAKFKTSEKGLTSEVAAKVLEEFGKNKLQAGRKLGIIGDFLGHFKSPLVIILLFASLVSLLMGDKVNSIIITVIVIISALLDFIEERNASNAAAKLRDSVKNTSDVIRDGRVQAILTEDIVKGDIVQLSAGKMIPADLRLITAKDLFINQSSLTGESFPAEKNSTTVAESASLDDLTDIALMGSSVISGSATGLVVETGMNTHFGSIAAKLISPIQESSFSRGVRDFGYLVMRITLMLIVFIFLVNGILKGNWLEAFMFGLAVAVGLTPELLTMVMSVSMARGSLEMAKRGAIVKKLNSIPNFGSMDVLCTDKTGTLTLDKIELIGCYDPSGNESVSVLRLAYLNSSFQSTMKNPLDDAILERKVDITGATKLDEIPFDFNRKRMSVQVRDGSKVIIITKGAPEEIMKIASTGAVNVGGVTQRYEELNKQGYKVIAIATKEMDEHSLSCTKADEQGLVLAGFVAFVDPPRPEAAEAIAGLRNLGIEVKIITGDHPLVAIKTCKDLGLALRGVLIGNEIDALGDDALWIRAEATTLFARFSPDQKNRIIRILQRNHTVGYMGDGINDAPSLRTSDVGISVNNATDVAKASADIILTDKSLLILKDAVVGGRRTFINTVKYIQMGLSSNFGNMFSMAAAAVYLPFLPMLPVQILLNNFIYDFSQVTIPTDNVDQELLSHPNKWNMRFLKTFMIVFGIVSSLFDLVTFYLFYHVYHVSEIQFQTAWFLESLTTQTLVIYFIRTRKTPFFQSNPSPPLVISSVACVIVGWAIAFTPLGIFFKLTPLPAYMILVILSLVAFYLVIVEFVKRAFYKRISI